MGRVWTAEELQQLGEICLRHHVIVVSDEIHNDFVYPGYEHTVFATVDPRFAEFTVTCTAPSKTFNLAGLQISNIFIPNEKLRKAFQTEIDKTGYDEPNALGIVACEAAYRAGEDWLDQLRAYLLKNLNFLRNFYRRRFHRFIWWSRKVPIWYGWTAVSWESPVRSWISSSWTKQDFGWTEDPCSDPAEPLFSA